MVKSGVYLPKLEKESFDMLSQAKALAKASFQNEPQSSQTMVPYAILKLLVQYDAGADSESYVSDDVVARCVAAGFDPEGKVVGKVRALLSELKLDNILVD